MKEVEEQIHLNNLTEIKTIFGSNKYVGNSLISLNNLINICERIKCKNIIIPYGLRTIIKNPIYYSEYNITIFPYSYKNILKIDIILKDKTIFHFKFKNVSFKNRLFILRNEIVNNLPKVIINKNELIIKIRSGDIFVNVINPLYAQPPLCFYQKIINQNNFKTIKILSNGHENPVVDKLLQQYPLIKYVESTLEEAISIIVNAYNMVYSVSTFQRFLILFNNNLKNLYIRPFNTKNINYTIHKMIPSKKYLEIMKDKWNNTKEQLYLMINENCINDTIYTIFPLKKYNI